MGIIHIKETYVFIENKTTKSYISKKILHISINKHLVIIT